MEPGSGFQVHLAQQSVEPWVISERIQEHVASYWNHHGVALADGAVHPGESLVDFSQAEMNPGEGGPWDISLDGHGLQTLQ